MKTYFETVLIIGLLFSVIHPTVATSMVSDSTLLPATTTSASASNPTTEAPSSTPWPTGETSSAPGSTTAGTTEMTTSHAVPSTYSNNLTVNSPTFTRPSGTSGYFYYYQAIQVTTYTTGTYTFRSSSLIDTYGCLYQGTFDPSLPSRNLITCDDDTGGGYQFLITRSLLSGGTYVLVVTTYRNDVTGVYSVTAMGPATVSMTSITPSTFYPTSTRLTTSPAVPSTYSNTLTVNSPTFTRPSGTSGYFYYYQAIQVTTYTTGTYTFRSSSLIDTYGCLYQGTFDPSIPSRNLITCDDDSGSGGQFLITRSLLSGGIYVLVVTTYSNDVTGAYSVTAMGPATVSMTSITPSTFYPTSTRLTTSASPETFSSALSLHSPIFSRPGRSDFYYYYEAIQLTTYTAGTYTFRSFSQMDTYGCLYQTYFDPSNPTLYMIQCDDDSGGSGQFLISNNLLSGYTYILVVTTYNTARTGVYSITAGGPGMVSMISITPIATTVSGTLSRSSPTFSRPYGYSSLDYYYASFQATTNSSDTYKFRSYSSIDTYGCLYDGSFDPSDRYHNLLTCDDDSGGSRQFSFSYYLLTRHTYVLVVTTSFASYTGDYSATVTGSGLVTMTSFTPNSNSLSAGQIAGIVFGCLIGFTVILGICILQCRRKQRLSRSRPMSPTYHTNPPAHYAYPSGAQGNPGPMNVVHTPYTTPGSTAVRPVVEEPPPPYQAYVSKLNPVTQTSN